MRAPVLNIPRLATLAALCAFVVLGATAAVASAAVPTVRNDHPGDRTASVGIAVGTVSTDSTLTECEFEYVKARIVGGGANFPGETPQSVDCSTSGGAPISGPGQVPDDSAQHSVSAEIPLVGEGVYYRLVAANASGPATAAGWQGTGFGFGTFNGLVGKPDNSPLTQAGAHPYSFKTFIQYNTFNNAEFFGGVPEPVEDAKDVTVTLPPGFQGSLAGVDQCTASQLAHTAEVGQVTPAPLCPSSSQIGVIYLRINLAEIGPFSLYNMVPPPGVAARFGATFAGTLQLFDSKLVPDSGDYRAVTDTPDISQGLSLDGNALEFWGVPSDASHDSLRSCPGERMAGGEGGPSCPSSAPDKAFFRTPTACTASGEALQFDVRGDSWQHPGDFVSSSFHTHSAPGFPEPPTAWGAEVGLEGCDQVPFEPTLNAQPTTERADSPSGLAVDIGLPRDCWDPKASAAEVEAAICQADMRSAQVILPKGFAINPAAAGGRQACSPAQAGVTSALGATPIEFDNNPVSCPNSSKIGAVEIATPLLNSPLKGDLFLAAQEQNPFKSLVAIYLIAEGPGVRIKQAAEIELGPEGRVTTNFDQVPQAPFSNIHFALFGGPRAVLRTPPTCGGYTTEATLTPWSGNDAVQRQSSFQITECPNSGFNPKLEAGTQNPLAGSTSSLELRVSREDGTEEVAGVSATLPEGVLAKLGSVSLCPDATIAAIQTGLGSGAAQIAAPSCPASSLVGTTTIAAGAGANPFYTKTGRVYFAGPYKGGPYSLVVVTPAVAGPLDLGTVVVRNALRIDPETTRVTAVSDPIPTILHGVPLDLRDIRIEVNRPDYTLNPTSCDPLAFNASLTSGTGAIAPRTNPFQAAGCDRLGFKPKLALSLRGPVHRRSHPALTATYTPRAGDANLARAQVSLPPAAFLDNSHIKTVCTRVQFAAQQCPAGSIYGHASATTPILNYPLYGNVYLRANPAHKLPDLVADLRGPSTQPIEVALAGRTDSVKGALRNTFELVPDAPVTKFQLQLFGRSKGLIEMSSGFCANPKASVSLDAQNGRGYNFNPKVKANCGKSGKAKHKRQGGSGK